MFIRTSFLKPRVRRIGTLGGTCWLCKIPRLRQGSAVNPHRTCLGKCGGRFLTSICASFFRAPLCTLCGIFDNLRWRDRGGLNYMGCPGYALSGGVRRSYAPTDQPRVAHLRYRVCHSIAYGIAAVLRRECCCCCFCKCLWCESCVSLVCIFLLEISSYAVEASRRQHGMRVSWVRAHNM